jgi:hypothetical protein
MKIGTHITRGGVGILAFAAAVLLAAPAALADPPPGGRAVASDAVDRNLANDRAHARQPTPPLDVIERYVESRARLGRAADRYEPNPSTGDSGAVSAPPVVSGGFDWGDAGLGAALGIAASLIAGGGVLIARRRLMHA